MTEIIIPRVRVAQQKIASTNQRIKWEKRQRRIRKEIAIKVKKGMPINEARREAHDKYSTEDCNWRIDSRSLMWDEYKKASELDNNLNVQHKNLKK